MNTRQVTTLTDQAIRHEPIRDCQNVVMSHKLFAALREAGLDLPDHATRVEIVLDVNEPVIVKVWSNGIPGTKGLAMVFREFVLEPKP